MIGIAAAPFPPVALLFHPFSKSLSLSSLPRLETFINWMSQMDASTARVFPSRVSIDTRRPVGSRSCHSPLEGEDKERLRIEREGKLRLLVVGCWLLDNSSSSFR